VLTILTASQLALAGAIDVDPIEGFPVTMQVLDTEGQPIPRAYIRHTEEGILHPVNQTTGEWRAEGLYLPTGDVHRFRQGEVVRFTVGAPGYLGREVRYRVKGMKHTVPVVLDPLGERGFWKRRRAKAEPSATWLAMVASLESAERDWNAPSFESDFRFTPETIQRLADPAEADVQLVAAFSTHLISQGPSHAVQADAWAREAQTRAQASLEGPDYVDMVDRMFKVRAVAANLAWQAAEGSLLDKPGSGRLQHDADASRRQAAAVAGDWLDYAVAAETTSQGFARALCVAAAVDPVYCE